jgi:SAM-dependent methyltransferase
MQKTVHRDSVDYWKAATSIDGGLSKAHPSPLDEVCKKYLNLLDIQQGHKVLDVGIGFGRFVDFYLSREAKIYGIDIDPKMIDDVKTSYGDKCHDLRVASVVDTGFECGFFDRIVCWGVFDELDQGPALLAMGKLLKPGGRLIVTGKNCLYSQDDEQAMLAEKGARSKNHPNSFTDIPSLDFELFGVSVAHARYFLRRGDFASDISVTDLPERFYEYLLILERTGELAVTMDDLPVIARKHSKTWLESRIDRDLSQTYGHVNDAETLMLSGVYRSGTTILAQLVGAHRDVYLTYDSIKYPRFCLDLEVGMSGRVVVEDIAGRITERWGIKFDVEKVIKTLPDSPSHAEIYERSLSHLRDNYKPAAQIYGEKIAVMWTSTPDFLEMFPKGKVIHIFRDPRDVVASFKNMTYEPGFAYLDAAFNCLHAMSALKDIQAYYGQDRVMLIRLEDLTEDPEATARKISEFLQREFDSGMVNPECYRDKVGNPWKNNSGFFPKSEGIMKNQERWREHLSKAEIFFIEMISMSKMVEYGYELSGAVPSRTEWDEIHSYIEDPVLSKRFKLWIASGKGVEGYPSNPRDKEVRHKS